MSLPKRRRRPAPKDDLLDGWDDEPAGRPSRRTGGKYDHPSMRHDQTARAHGKISRSNGRRKDDMPPKDKPYTYHGYHGNGYPKGLLDDDGFPIGPVVRRYDRARKKYVKVAGVAYEDLPRSYQRILDKKPYDDAGQLRIFRKPAQDPDHKGKPLLSGGNIFLEYGSYEQAKMFFKSMQTKEDSIYNGENIGYSSRPALDDLHVYTRGNSKEAGFKEPDSPQEDGNE